jgi:hypothetical protein
MSKAAEKQLEETEEKPTSEPQLEVSPNGKLTPFVDTRTDEQKAADEKLKQQVKEYQELYKRGEIGEAAYNSVILHRLAGRFSIIREFQRAFTSQLLRFMKPESEFGQGLTLDEAIKKAESFMEGTTAEKLFTELKYRSVNNINWLDFEHLFRLDPAAAEALWKRLKIEAREDFESGSFAAKIFDTTEWRRDPWRRAEYVGIRDAFIDDHKPRGAIELSMVDMAVTAYFLYYYWAEILMQRSETPALPEMFTHEERKRMERHDRRYEWVPPRVTEQDAIEHAAQMADRFRRQYLSAIRGLRDYRRYGPVIINNKGQVNIADDGAQQLNVQQKGKKRAKHKQQAAPGTRRLKVAT